METREVPPAGFLGLVAVAIRIALSWLAYAAKGPFYLVVFVMSVLGLISIFAIIGIVSGYDVFSAVFNSLYHMGIVFLGFPEKLSYSCTDCDLEPILFWTSIICSVFGFAGSKVMELVFKRKPGIIEQAKILAGLFLVAAALFSAFAFFDSLLQKNSGFFESVWFSLGVFLGMMTFIVLGLVSYSIGTVLEIIAGIGQVQVEKPKT